MKSKLTIALVSVFAIIGVASAVPNVALASPAGEINKGVNQIGGNSGGSLESNIKTIVNMMLFILGAVAVVMIVIGGIKYTTSNGDASSIKGAKDTILYSVVGLVVAILAYAIVNFVVDAFK